MKKKLYMIPNQHMDLVWRRCFDRDIVFQGQNFVSYADLEEIYIKDSLALCSKYDFYHFTVESVAVLDKFLERNPELDFAIGEAIRRKRLYVPFTGNNIVDSNLISGESLVRNFLQGYWYLKSRFDHIPDGADRNDAFGNSAQLPQIFRNFGVKWVYHVTYTPCEAPYWKGLDGSVVYNLEPPQAGTIGGYPKYPPCPACGGFKDRHCSVCGNRRIDQAHMDRRRFRLLLDEAAIAENDLPCYILVGGEEVAPMEDAPLWAQENSHRFDIEFTNFEVYAQHRRAEIDMVDAPPAELVAASAECNCNNTGVYVSRIRVKQKLRRLEHSIFTAETLAASDWILGKPYPRAQLDGIWKTALFTMFHDAITSTHVDAGYEEVCDALDSAQVRTDRLLPTAIHGPGPLQVFNPRGLSMAGACSALLAPGFTVAEAPILSREQQGENTLVQFFVAELPAWGTRPYTVVPEDAPRETVCFSAREASVSGDGVLTNRSVARTNTAQHCPDVLFENEFYRISITDRGIQEIFHKPSGMPVAQESQYMVGEWILECDYGSPWATLSTDMRRFPLSGFTRIEEHRKTAHAESVTFLVIPDIRYGNAETALEIRCTVTLAQGVDEVFFRADVNWQIQSHRLRVAFPTPLRGKHFYDIPYGSLERKPYQPNILLPDGASDWAGAAGDYPAIHWAGIDAGDCSLVLFNRGTPSYQISPDAREVDTLYLSVLRSPIEPTCLHAGADYSMTAYEGMRDAGQHSFDFALKGYACSLSDSTVHADGLGYNAGFLASAPHPIAQLPQILTPNAWISSISQARDGNGLILRAAEYRGRAGNLGLFIPPWVQKIWETDMKEDPIRELTAANGRITTQIGPFEIKTFRLLLPIESSCT